MEIQEFVGAVNMAGAQSHAGYALRGDGFVLRLARRHPRRASRLNRLTALNCITPPLKSRVLTLRPADKSVGAMDLRKWLMSMAVLLRCDKFVVGGADLDLVQEEFSNFQAALHYLAENKAHLLTLRRAAQAAAA